MQTEPCPVDWGLSISPTGELNVGALGILSLARDFGTPLHVVNENRLIQNATEFRAAVQSAYPGKTSVHYAFKCNSVPAVVSTIRSTGLNAEVTTEFELELAFRIGFSGAQIVVNGPWKTTALLTRSVMGEVRFIIVDSLQELESLSVLARQLKRTVNILLRVNPDFIPRRMNRGTATGSRKGCAFGLDLKGGEVKAALRRLRETTALHFHGFHFHIGTGVQDPRDYARALTCLPHLTTEAQSNGFRVQVLDVGGGFASATSREMTSREMLAYQAFGKLPKGRRRDGAGTIPRFAESIARSVRAHYSKGFLPELIFEPGRCIASSSQFLLLTVQRVKERDRVGTWLIADGGLSTVTMPTYYEYHEVLLCNDVTRPRTKKVTIIGPACFAGDVVYRNKLMPEVRPGEVIAIMDSGAYFTALESSFGFPRPAIAVVRGSTASLARTRETFDDMVARDIFVRKGINPEVDK